MRRALKWLLAMVAAVLALPVLAVALILVVANTAPGRRLIQTETASLTGDMVSIQELAGRFPDSLRIGQIQVSDVKGPYVTIKGLVLDWSPLKLLRRTAQVDRLTAATIEVSRLPASGGSSKSSGGSFNLPVRVDLRRLHVERVAIGAPVVGSAAVLALDGSGELETLTDGTIHLDVQRLDSQGHYVVDGTVAATHVQASVKADEPSNGLISGAAALPNLGAIAVDIAVDGPWDAVATQVGVSAGPLRASASGTIDLVHDAADLALKATAPAMAPASGVSWNSVLIDATAHGPFKAADAAGTVRIQALDAAGVRIGALNADVAGNAGRVRLHATIDDLHVPGPKPDLLAASPVLFDASARLDAADRPVTFALHHPLVALDGSGTTGGERQLQAHLALPDLAPLAAAGGVDIQGSTGLDLQAGMVGDTTSVTVKGDLALTGGTAPVPALVGPAGHVDVVASMQGGNVTLSRLALNGKAIDVSAQGGMVDQVVNLNWTVRLAEMAALQPDLSGTVAATGRVAGKLDALAVNADVETALAAKGYAPSHVNAHVDATGLPSAPHASVTADGTLLNAPLSLDLKADRTDGTLHATIDHATWKSLRAEGDVSLTLGAALPEGRLRINLARLADLQPLLGHPVAGQAAATLDSDNQAAKLSVTIADASVPGTVSIRNAALNAVVTDPKGRASVDGTLTVDGVSAGPAIGASVRLAAKGTRDALALTLAANAPSLFGAPAKFAAAGNVNVDNRSLALNGLEASWKQQPVKLLAPAKLAFSDGVSMDRLRLGFRRAELSMAGSAGSKLDLTASLKDLPADVGAVVEPSLAADGVIAAEARLTGTSARPEGTVKLTANRIHLRQGPGQALPPADMAVNVVLLGTQARLDARLAAGQSHLAAAGLAPLSAAGPLDISTDGHVDLTVLNPLLAAQGRRVKGVVNLKAAVTGTITAPLASGTIVLADGDVTDTTIGTHVSDLAATLTGSGEAIRLTQFSGKAGPGTLGGSGTVSLAGAMPVDLHFTADNARPVSSDLLTALLDANFKVQGEVKGNLQASGTLHVRRADIRIPDKLPASVAVLPVRDASAPPPPPPPAAPTPSVALDLTLNAPEQVFIRGRGLNAELGGKIHIGGTAANPLPDGGLHLRQGTLSVIGTSLNFTEGTIDFSGGGIANPSLHFVATSATTTIVATVTISGSAKDPKITLSSVPDMPQDEILAQLLFNTSTSKLSPLQLAQIAAALASLSGATSGADPLEKLRTALGLDRLSVGSSTSGAPTLEAGRYVTRRIYLGAKQAASGTGSQAVVQVDITKGLKLQATAGSGTTSATGATSSADAASVGLTYQFEY